MLKVTKILIALLLITTQPLVAFFSEDKMLIKRRQGKEILDYEKMPPLVRDPVYTSLGLTHNIAGLSNVLRTKVLLEILLLNTTHVVELGSGSGLNLKILAEESKGRGINRDELRFLLTDKFPNKRLWRSISSSLDNLFIYEEPFEFSHVISFDGNEAEKLTFLVIAASHHMSDDAFKKFLHDCAQLRANIIIVEPLERKLTHAGLSVLASYSGLLTPFMKDLSLRDRAKQMAIYYSGLGLFIQSYDGIVSTLRQRTKKEFIALAQECPYIIKEQKNLGKLSNYTITTFQFKE